MKSKATDRKQLTKLVLSMQVGSSFTVRDNKERVAVNQIAAVLSAAGSIGFTVKTRRNKKGGGFTATAHQP